MERIRRGPFLKMLAAGIALPSLPACKESLVGSEIKQAADTLSQWQFGGRTMLEHLPHLRNTIDVMAGWLDPRQFNPLLNLPIKFTYTSPDQNPQIKYVAPFDTQNPKKYQFLHKPDGSLREASYLKSMEATVSFPNTPADPILKALIIAKEVSDVIDLMQYARVYVDLFAKGPLELKTTTDAARLSFAFTVLDIEKKTYGNSWFEDFRDVGGSVRVGSILYSNFHIRNQDQIKNQPAVLTRPGIEISRLMQQSGFIRLDANGVFVWSYGQPPEISSPGFINLVSKVIGPIRLPTP